MVFNQEIKSLRVLIEEMLQDKISLEWILCTEQLQENEVTELESRITNIKADIKLAELEIYKIQKSIA